MTFKDFVGGGSTGLVGAINTIIVPLIFGLVFIAFIWGVVHYFFIKPSGTSSFGERGGYAEGRQFVLWGLLGIVILVSVWGIVNMLLSTLGIR